MPKNTLLFKKTYKNIFLYFLLIIFICLFTSNIQATETEIATNEENNTYNAKKEIIVTFDNILKPKIEVNKSENKNNNILKDYNFFKPYIEETIIALASDSKKVPLNKWQQELLPYIIYAETFSPNKRLLITDYEDLLKRHNIKSLNDFKNFEYLTIKHDVFINYFIEAERLEKLIKKKAFLEHEAKYAYLNTPLIKEEELAKYESKGKQGNLEAIFELRRYYANPFINNYNPEQSENRYWLLKAIEFGSKEAKLELGYEHPYVINTELNYMKSKITLSVNCEKIDKSNFKARPACFIYNLTIDNQLISKSYLILVEDYLNSNSISPHSIILKKINNKVLIELQSQPDDLLIPDLARLDYFDLEGNYLGSNKKEYGPQYFWNYNKATLSKTFPIPINSKKTIIEQKEINKLPIAEAFIYWESIYPKKEKSVAMADIYNVIYENEDTDFSMLWRYNFYSELVVPRISKFFKLNLYQDYDFFLTNLKNSVLWDFIKQEYFYEEMNSHSPNERKIFYNYADFDYLFTNKEINITNLEKFYKELDVYFPYILHGYSEDYKAKMMLVCQAYDERLNVGLEQSCYAFQIQFQLGEEIKYYYIIDSTISNKKEINLENKIDNIKTIGIRNPKLNKIKNKIDGKNYYILNDVFGTWRGCEFDTCSRYDLFDENFNYIGSNQASSSSTMVKNFKPLPPYLRTTSENEILIGEYSLLKSAMNTYQTYIIPGWNDLAIEYMKQIKQKRSNP